METQTFGEISSETIATDVSIHYGELMHMGPEGSKVEVMLVFDFHLLSGTLGRVAVPVESLLGQAILDGTIELLAKKRLDSHL